MSRSLAQWAIKEAPKMYPDLSSGALHLLIVLSDYYNEDQRKAWPSLVTLAKDMHCSKQSVIRHMKELTAAGLVVKRFRPNDTNTYRVRRVTPMEVASEVVTNWNRQVSNCDHDSNNLEPLEVTICDPNIKELENNNVAELVGYEKDQAISSIITDLKKAL